MRRPRPLALVLLLALAACNGSSRPGQSLPDEAGRGPVAFETVIQRSIPGQSGGEVREAARDAAAWASLWVRLREGAGATLPEEPPAVDFSREMVIAAAMETQGCVSRVTIQGIRQGRGELVVDLLEAPPAPNCVCVTSERPLHAVRLPLSPDPVRFEVTRGQTTCG
jgi:hypothetical protein